MYIIYKKSKVNKDKIRTERFTSDGSGVSFFKDLEAWKKHKEGKKNDLPKTS